MSETPIGQSSFDTGGGAAVGEASKVSARGNNRFQADTQALQELDTALTKINTNINKLKNDLPKVISLTEQWASKMRMVSNAMGGMGGGKGAPASPNGAPAGTLTDSLLGGGGGGGMFNTYHIQSDRSQNLTMMGGGGGKGGSAADVGKQIASQVASALGAALNNRINENAGYSLSASKLDMLLQQTSGMSRQDVYSTKRQPLQQYKLGAGGINSVLALQASTGIDALKQAKSVESLRASSGYAYSTDQINQMTRGMASAQSNNRMFMTMGTGMYGVGGQQKSSMTVVKDVVQRLGLTTESALSGAMAPGSMTRERLRQSGLPEDMQDLVLQYAQQNIAYKKKGGAGMYDASNKGMRKTMGVEDSYANQNEETSRVKGNREENMYKRQADNYAAMEKGMQSLTRTMEQLDNAMAGLVGAKIRTRGIGSLIKGALPMAGTIAGAVIGTAIGGPGAGTMAGASIGGAIGNFGASLGDATGEKETNAQKLNSKSSGTPANVTRSQGALSKLNPKMRQKVEAMMRENPKLYIGGGVRSSAEQKAMFMSRYKPTTEKTDVFWKGQYWKRHTGAAAAPPGMSMHEIGLAADMAPTSQHEWVKNNAHRFGLRSFFDVNDEPWHVQPAELPGSRMQYEKNGAPWGHNGQVVEPTDLKATINNAFGMEHPSGSGGVHGNASTVNSKIQDYAELSINDAIAAMGPTGEGSSGSTGNVQASSINNSGNPGSSSKGSGPLSGRQVAAIMYKAGFRGKRLVEAVAIAQRESRFNPSSFANDSDDLSYGLMQINMKGSMGPGRRKTYNLKKNEDLFNPDTNAQVAWKLSGHGNNWDHWKLNGDPLAKTNVPQAAKFVKQAGYATSGDPKQGDPVTGMGMGGASGNQITAMSSKRSPRGQQALATYTAGTYNTPKVTAKVSTGTTYYNLLHESNTQSSKPSQNNGGSYNVTISPTIHLHGGSSTAMDAQKISREIAAHVERQMRLTLQRNR